MITINGLQGDGFLIDNPIYVELETDNPDIYYWLISFENTVNSQTVSNIIIYPNNNENSRLNISPTLKTLFTLPQHESNYTSTSEIEMPNNSNLFGMSVTAFYLVDGIVTEGESTFVSKTFIRGGFYQTYELTTNRMIPSGKVLQNADQIPYFPGYPCALYYLTNDKKINKKNIFLFPYDAPEIDRKRIKGCDGAYIKFLNSLGGYSYWLFENWKETSDNDHFGSSNSYSQIMDYGSEMEFTYEAMSKVPIKYKGLMTDLIASKEIYLWLENGAKGLSQWKRLILKSSNKIEVKKSVPYVEASIKFEQVKNYNPSLLW